MKTYVTDELPLKLQHFLADYGKVYHAALVDTVNRLLAGESTPDQSESEFKSQLKTYLQDIYRINRRQANAVITEASGMIGSAKECRNNHIKELESKLKSAKDWLKKKQKQLKDSQKFYRSKKWQNKKNAPRLRFSSSLEHRRTTWQCHRFQIHNKKRYIAHLERKIAKLKAAPIKVKISHQTQAYFVGSKGETWGNQVCQFDGETLKIRVPGCLEHIYGEYVTVEIGQFAYGAEQIQQALSTPGETVSKSGVRTPIEYGVAMTYRFYYKNFCWFMAVSFDLPAPKRVTKSRHYGCIGIDLNPDSIGWAYVDYQGNLKAKGKIALQLSGFRKGQVKAIIGDAVKELTILADTYACPIVCESLDFSREKGELREKGRKYARMLSNFAYSRFFQALSGRCFNLGIELIQVNPAYSSLIGLVKYAKMYGLASDSAAGLAIARRGMRLSERLPHAITALLQVNCSRHVWHGWNQLNKKLSGMKRHSFYSTVSNWEPLVNPDDESDSSDRSSGKPKRTKGSART